VSDATTIVGHAVSKAALLGTTRPVAPIDIITACTDPGIFGPWFRDQQSFAAWFCFLKVAFGLPLDDAELETFRRCTGRDVPAAVGYLLATLIVGRRGGKSLILALIAAYMAAFYDWSPYLTGGERASIVILPPIGSRRL
jgi:hypothetical protein